MHICQHRHHLAARVPQALSILRIRDVSNQFRVVLFGKLSKFCQYKKTNVFGAVFKHGRRNLTAAKQRQHAAF